jgi:ubiquinone/menaquinone biosynthesis C-methylase UbiE
MAFPKFAVTLTVDPLLLMLLDPGLQFRPTGGFMIDYEAELLKLYAAQNEMKQDLYLHAHSRNRAVIRRQVSIFLRCQGFLQNAHTVLDWGCRHAVDACLVRMLQGSEAELYGCDVDAADYKAFFDFARLSYARLTHPYLLPYDDNSFDAVIGSGVLEHVPNDSESLKELYRVIKPGGFFIMTMLPNKLSYTEWLNRRLGNPHHLRTYSLAEARRMCMHHGFLPISCGYHQVLPTLSSPKGGIFDFPLANRLVEKLFSLNYYLERLWPINRLATNIFIVARKVEAFHG